MSSLLGIGNFLVERQLESQKRKRRRFGLSQSSAIIISKKSFHPLVSIEILQSLFIETTCKLCLCSTFCQQDTNFQFKIDLE